MNIESPKPVEELLPLTPAQGGMLLDLLRGDALAGTLVGVVRFELEGPCDADAIEAALRSCVADHSALRAAILWEGLKTPVQAIHRTVDPGVDHLDWSDLTDAQQTQAEADLVATERQRSFNLRQAPLMHVTLVRRAKDRHLVVWTLHHLIADGWSGSVLINNVLGRLAGKASAPDTGLRSYLVWQKRRDRTREDAFWLDYLAGLNPVTALTLGHGSTARRDTAQSRLTLPVPAALAE